MMFCWRAFDCNSQTGPPNATGLPWCTWTLCNCSETRKIRSRWFYKWGFPQSDLPLRSRKNIGSGPRTSEVCTVKINVRVLPTENKCTVCWSAPYHDVLAALKSALTFVREIATNRCVLRSSRFLLTPVLISSYLCIGGAKDILLLWRNPTIHSFFYIVDTHIMMLFVTQGTVRRL